MGSITQFFADAWRELTQKSESESESVSTERIVRCFMVSDPRLHSVVSN